MLDDEIGFSKRKKKHPKEIQPIRNEEHENLSG